MRIIFLRNCRNKGEFLLFKNKHPEYMDIFDVEINKIVKFSKNKIKLLESNTQSLSLWNNINFKDYSEFDGVAKCIKIIDDQEKPHSIIFFNGYNYAKYISYINS
jgi:hypothetical protein